MASGASLAITLSATDAASPTIRSVSSALGNMASIAGGFVIGAALTKLPGLLSDAVGAAQDDEAATLRLQQALKNIGGDFDSHLGKVNAAITAGQKLAFSDDEVRDSFQFLAAATGDVDEALRRQQSAMDLARGANIPLAQASKMLGKLSAENVEVFKKLGITMGDNASEADVLAAVQKKFGDQASTYAKSTAGQFEQAKLALSETSEAIGNALLPIVTTLARALADALPTIQGWVESLAEFAGPAIASALGALAPFAEAIGALVAAFSEGGLGGAVAHLQGLFPPLGAAIAFLSPIFDSLVTSLTGLGDTISASVGPLLESLVPLLQELAPIVGGVLVVAVGVLMGALKGLAQVLNVALVVAVPIVKAALDVLVAVIRHVKTVITDMVAVVKAVLAGDWGAAWEAAKKLVTDNFAGIIHIVQTAIDRVVSVIGAIGPVLLAVVRGDWQGAMGLIAAASDSTAERVAAASDSTAGAIVGMADTAGIEAAKAAGATLVVATSAETNFGRAGDAAAQLGEDVKASFGPLMLLGQQLADKVALTGDMMSRLVANVQAWKAELQAAFTEGQALAAAYGQTLQTDVIDRHRDLATFIADSADVAAELIGQAILDAEVLAKEATEKAAQATEKAAQATLQSLQGIFGVLPQVVGDALVVFDNFTVGLGNMAPEWAAQLSGWAAQVNALPAETRKALLGGDLRVWEEWAAGINAQQKLADDAAKAVADAFKKSADELANYYARAGAEGVASLQAWLAEGTFTVQGASSEIKEILSTIPAYVLDNITVFKDFTLSLDALAPEWQEALRPFMELVNSLPLATREALGLDIGEWDRWADALKFFQNQAVADAVAAAARIQVAMSGATSGGFGPGGTMYTGGDAFYWDPKIGGWRGKAPSQGGHYTPRPGDPPPPKWLADEWERSVPTTNIYGTVNITAQNDAATELNRLSELVR